MKTIYFDFSTIHTIAEFYNLAIDKLELPSYFGFNMDALWDWLTAGMALPCEIVFIHIDQQQANRFRLLISTMHEAAKQSDGQLIFKTIE